MNIVLDTNVLVSGLSSPYGIPAEIVRMVASGSLTLCVDARIVTEYAEVLAQPTFGFELAAVEALIDQIVAESVQVAAHPLVERLPDTSDEPFLEVAIAGQATCLVTGNLAHFPPTARVGVTVASPAEFLELVRDERRRG